jgi:hypothetical protein
MFRRVSLLLSFALVLSVPLAIAQPEPKEHTLDYSVQLYEQEARVVVDQSLRKRANCSTQFKVQIDPEGRVLAMIIDGSECSPSEQKKLSKQIVKIIFPRFKDEFLHHSRGQLPVLLIKLTPGEQTRVQALWGAR